MGGIVAMSVEQIIKSLEGLSPQELLHVKYTVDTLYDVATKGVKRVTIYRVLVENWIEAATLDHIEAHRLAKELIDKEYENLISGKTYCVDRVEVAPIYLYPWQVDFFLKNLYIED